MRTPPSPSTSTTPPVRVPVDVLNSTQIPNLTAKAKEVAASQLAGTEVLAAAAEAAKGVSEETHRTRKERGKEDPEDVLYDRSPPWYIRWMWVLIGVDVLWTGNLADLIWEHWTYKPNDPPGTQLPPEIKPPPVAELGVGYIPRPAWQRAGLCGIIIAGGSIAAFALISARVRAVTRLVALPSLGAPKGAFREVRIETARGRRYDVILEKKACALSRTKDDSEIILQTGVVNRPNARSQYWLGLVGANVQGRKGIDGPEVQRWFHAAWHGESPHPENEHPGRWVAGPAAQ